MVTYDADQPTAEILDAAQMCLQDRGIRIYDGPIAPTHDTLNVTVSLSGERKRTILISLRDADHPEIEMGQGRESNVEIFQKTVCLRFVRKALDRAYADHADIIDYRPEEKRK